MAAKECKLLTEYNTATAETLAAIDEEIAKVEGEAKECAGRIAGLHTLRRAIDEKLNGKKARKPMVRKAKAAGSVKDEQRERVAKYLLHSGAARPGVLVAALNIPLGSLTAVLDHPWFEKRPEGVALSAEGRKKAG